MKRLLVISVLALSLFAASGCGFLEKFYDNASYESLTDEKVELLQLYSGGILIAEYPNVKIIYSDSDSFAMWFKTEEGAKKYWQGEAQITFSNDKVKTLYDMVDESRR